MTLFVAGKAAKTKLIMKLTAVFLLIATVHVSATSFSQKVSIRGKGLLLEDVFQRMHTQTGYAFVYNQTVLDHAQKVTLNVKDLPVTDVLNACLLGQGLAYSIRNNIITISRAVTNSPG